jgi:translocation protein SEC63
MFGKGSTAPIILICLVGFGVLLPLGIAVFMILRFNQYGGTNNILRQTQYNFYHKLKAHMKLALVPEVDTTQRCPPREPHAF